MPSAVVITGTGCPDAAAPCPHFHSPYRSCHDVMPLQPSLSPTGHPSIMEAKWKIDFLGATGVCLFIITCEWRIRHAPQMERRCSGSGTRCNNAEQYLAVTRSMTRTRSLVDLDARHPSEHVRHAIITFPRPCNENAPILPAVITGGLYRVHPLKFGKIFLNRCVVCCRKEFGAPRGSEAAPPVRLH